MQGFYEEESLVQMKLAGIERVVWEIRALHSGTLSLLMLLNIAAFLFSWSDSIRSKS